MLIKINAIVREEKFEDVKEALNKIGVNGITVSQVMGCGAQKGFTEVIRGTKVDMMMRPKIKFEIVVSSEEWERNASTAFSIRGIYRAHVRFSFLMIRSATKTS